MTYCDILTLCPSSIHIMTENCLERKKWLKILLAPSCANGSPQKNDGAIENKVL